MRRPTQQLSLTKTPIPGHPAAVSNWQTEAEGVEITLASVTRVWRKLQLSESLKLSES